MKKLSKRDFKKLALLGIASGAIVSAPGVNAAEASVNASTLLAMSGCGSKQGCGGAGTPAPGMGTTHYYNTKTRESSDQTYTNYPSSSCGSNMPSGSYYYSDTPAAASHSCGGGTGHGCGGAKPATQNGQMAPRNGQMAPQNGQMAPQNGQMMPQNGQMMPQNGQMAPQNGQMMQQNAPQPMPQQGATYYSPRPSQRPTSVQTSSNGCAATRPNMGCGAMKQQGKNNYTADR